MENQHNSEMEKIKARLLGIRITCLYCEKLGRTCQPRYTQCPSRGFKDFVLDMENVRIRREVKEALEKDALKKDD